MYRYVLYWNANLPMSMTMLSVHQKRLHLNSPHAYVNNGHTQLVIYIRLFVMHGYVITDLYFIRVLTLWYFPRPSLRSDLAPRARMPRTGSRGWHLRQSHQADSWAASRPKDPRSMTDQLHRHRRPRLMWNPCRKMHLYISIVFNPTTPNKETKLKSRQRTRWGNFQF